MRDKSSDLQESIKLKFSVGAELSRQHVEAGLRAEPCRGPRGADVVVTHSSGVLYLAVDPGRLTAEQSENRQFEFCGHQWLVLFDVL